MKKFSRKMIAVLVMLAFFGQLFAPAFTFAQAANTQKAQIDEAVQKFKGTYDKIMALEPLELGGIANFAIGAIDWTKGVVADVVGFFGGESEEEKIQRHKEEEYKKYKAQIDKANDDIKQLKADAQATMDLLKSGAVQDAAKTDPTKVYNNLNESTSALGIYQGALKTAGEKLLDIGDKIAKAGTVIGLITAILIPVSVIFPVIAPAIPIFKGITLAVEIAAGVVKAAGNTLITASEKAITDDKGFMQAAALETSLQVVETGTDIILDKTGVKALGKAGATTVVGGSVNTIRDINRSGATGSDALRIAGRNFYNSGVSSAIGFATDSAVGNASKNYTSSLKIKNKDVAEGVTGAFESGLGQVADPAKSQTTDNLSIKDPEDKPKANSTPGLSGGGAW